jgi:hypothetical protein
MVQHPYSKPVIFVGGTCLETLLRHRFAPRFHFGRAARGLLSSLGQRYGPELLDPHNWLTWVIENAPRRLHAVAAELQVFGAAASDQELRKLIEYHDQHRLFHRDALLGSGALFGRLIGETVPANLTIEQARKLLLAHDAPALLAEVEFETFRRKEIAPVLKDIEAMRKTFERLGAKAQRAVVFLAKLSSALEERAGTIAPDPEMNDWPSIGEPPAFVWHARIGLGFIEPYDLLGAGKANVWLWRSGTYAPSPFLLTYWKGVSGVRAPALERLYLRAMRPNAPAWLRPNIMRRGPA